MNSYKRIVREKCLVRVTTVKNEEFIGTLLPMYFIITENDAVSAEIYLSQHQRHKGKDFGTVGFPLSYIKSIEKL